MKYSENIPRSLPDGNGNPVADVPWIAPGRDVIFLGQYEPVMLRSN
jgi:hypothetical protein